MKKLHNNWRDYTEDDISRIDKDHCVNCVFSKKIYSGLRKPYLICDFTCMTDYCRFSDAEDCEYFINKKDKDSANKINDIKERLKRKRGF